MTQPKLISRQAAEKDRQQRAQDKAEVFGAWSLMHTVVCSPQRRAQLKEALQLDRYVPAEEAVAPAAPQADVFETPQYTTVVTTHALAQEGESDGYGQTCSCCISPPAQGAGRG